MRVQRVSREVNVTRAGSERDTGSASMFESLRERREKEKRLPCRRDSEREAGVPPESQIHAYGDVVAREARDPKNPLTLAARYRGKRETATLPIRVYE